VQETPREERPDPGQPWPVVTPTERAQVVTMTRRLVARATVTASLPEIQAWARERGLTCDISHGHSMALIDAYIVAQYEAETTEGETR
jgi:hypothetical protein